MCRDMADYKDDVIICHHATDSKVARNICKQRLEEKMSKGSCLDVKARAPIVNLPHQKEISAIKTDRKVSKVECVSGSHNINFTGEELVHYFFNLISPMMMKPEPEPTGELYNFTEKEFQDFFENKPELMLCVLSSYTANWQTPKELIELEQ